MVYDERRLDRVLEWRRRERGGCTYGETLWCCVGEKKNSIGRERTGACRESVEGKQQQNVFPRLISSHPSVVLFADCCVLTLLSLSLPLSFSIFLQAAAGVAAAKPSFAAYGDSANVWGSITNDSGECAGTQKKMLTGMGAKLRGGELEKASLAWIDVFYLFIFFPRQSCGPIGG